MNDFGRQAQHPTADRPARSPAGAEPEHRPYPGHTPAGQPGPWPPLGGPPPRPPLPGHLMPTGPAPQHPYGHHGQGASYGPGWQSGPHQSGPHQSGPYQSGPHPSGPHQPGPQRPAPEWSGQQWPGEDRRSRGPAAPPLWPAQPDASQPRPARQDPARQDPARRDPAQDSARQDPARQDPARQDPAGGAPTPPRRSRRGQWIGATILLAGLAGFGWYVGQSAPAAAVLGDCVTQTGNDDISIVGCGEPSAQFRVVGRLEDRTMIDAGLFACSEFADATSSFWQGEAGPGELGMVLCLAPVTA